MPVEERRDYEFSMADFIGACNAVQTFMVRDTLRFADYGIDALEIAAFRTDIDEIELLPQDDEMRILVTVAAEAKNIIRVDLEAMLRAIEQRARLAFGKDVGKLQLFRIVGLTKESDGGLLLLSRRIKRYCDLDLAALTPYGMTQLMIDELQDKIDEFELAMDNVVGAQANRDAATNNRNAKSNALYAKLQRYCSTGKAIWFSENEAYYNDYVLYSQSPGVPGKIHLLSFEAPSQTLSWGSEPSATSYELQFTVDVLPYNWLQIYMGPNLSFVHPMGPGSTLYRVRGINDNGAGYWSDNLEVVRV